MFSRCSAALGITIKEMTVQSKPQVWNVVLLSCATEPHFCRVFFLSSSRSRSKLDTSVNFQLSLVGRQLQHYFYIHSLSARVAAVVPCLCEVMNALGCCWKFYRGYGDVVKFHEMCEGSLLLTWGNPFLTFLFSGLVQLFEGFQPH